MNFLLSRYNILPLLWSLSVVFLLMVGRIYDERFTVNGINIVLFINLIPIFAIFIHAITARKVAKKVYGYIFVILLLTFYSLILFSIYGYNDFENYSLNKTVYLVYIFIPIIYFKYAQGLNNNFFLCLYVACFVFFLFGMLKITSSSDRMSLFGGGPIVFARWIGIFSILSLYFIKNKIIKLILVLLSFVLMIKAGSKGPFIFLLISLLFRYLFVLNVKRIFILLFSVTIIIYNYLDLIIQSVGPRLAVLFSIDILDATSSIGRIDRWRLAIEVFLKNPLGVGLGNFVPVAKSIEPNDFKLDEYPHNLFLELFSELGVVGIVISLFVIFKFYKRLQDSKYPLYQKQLLIFLILNALVSGDLRDSRFFFLILL
mgnify:CR=1 FL=1